MRIYPNPTAGSVTIETDTPGEPLMLDVCDLSGHLIIDSLHLNSGKKTKLELKTGSYIFNIRQLNSNKLTSRKVQFMNF